MFWIGVVDLLLRRSAVLSEVTRLEPGVLTGETENKEEKSTGFPLSLLAVRRLGGFLFCQSF